jgi:predicted PurR-regulated permease PerM
VTLPAHREHEAALARTAPDPARASHGGPAGDRLRRTITWGLAALVVAGVLWVAGQVLLHLWLVTFTLAIALLLTALLWPLVRWLRRTGITPGVASFVALLLLLSALLGLGLLLWTRINGMAGELIPALTAAIDDLRTWLTQGPLGLDPARVNELRNQVVASLQSAAPSPVSGARTALRVLAALALGLFATFFFLKDGPAMWGWVLQRTERHHRDRVDGAGRVAWATLSGYIAGVTVIALADAAFIGLGLLLVGVPLWLSLTLLVFVGAYVPVLGATVSGVVAVVVTLVTQGGADAVIILVVVLAVQQLEGNVLQPLVMGQAVHLHPVVTLFAVTAGTLLLGIAGAILAVPLVAVAYRVAEQVRLTSPRRQVVAHPAGSRDGPWRGDSGDGGSGGGTARDDEPAQEAAEPQR